jgi:hypothetical protein
MPFRSGLSVNATSSLLVYRDTPPVALRFFDSTPLDSTRRARSVSNHRATTLGLVHIMTGELYFIVKATITVPFTTRYRPRKTVSLSSIAIPLAVSSSSTIDSALINF